MKKVKKIISAIVLATMLFTTLFASVSCGGGRKTSGFSQFEVSYYYGPHGFQAAHGITPKSTLKQATSAARAVIATRQPL